MHTTRDNHAKCIEAAITAAILAALTTTTPAQQRRGAVGTRHLSIDSRWVAPEPNALASATSTAQFDPLESPPFVYWAETRAIALGDVDGDGDLDIVLGNSNHVWGSAEQSRLYLNDGRGAYTDATATQLPLALYHTSALALGDVDGDGDLDLVLGNGTLSGGIAEQNRLYLNDGTGRYTDATNGRIPSSSGGRTMAVLLRDVEGDGDLDLVVGNDGTQDQLLLNDGAGSFSQATPNLPLNGRTRALAMGDVDGDGDLDLVMGNYWLLDNRLYLNDGHGVFTDVTAGRLPPGVHGTRAVALGDVDGDGDLDLVAGNGLYYYGERNRLYLNDGSGTFTNATVGRLPELLDTTDSVVFGDVDGDGDLDLVTGTGYDVLGSYGGFGQPGPMRLFLNDGSGSFTDATNRIPSFASYTNVVALGDVDADGDLDLVTGHYNSSSRVYLNLLRQLDTPLPPTLGQTYTLDVYGRYGYAGAGDVAYPFLAVATGRFPTVFGIFGLGPPVIVALPPVAIDPIAGVGSFALAIPSDPVFTGIPLFAQALLVQQGSIRLTNVTGGTIQ